MRYAVCGLAALLLLAAPARAEMSGGKIKIGVLTDLSGPYEQNSGVGSVEAAKMAAEEFGDTINGAPSKSYRPITRTSPISAPRSRAAGSTSTASMR